MGALNRFLVLKFVFLILISLIVLSITPAEVQAVPKPSVPEFSVKFIDNSYTVPPTQTTDPYTGVTTTQPSYIVKDGRIEVTINNLPPTSYKTPEGYECKLYYRVQYKGHFEEKWNSFSIMYYGVASDYYVHFVESSETKSTVVSKSFNDWTMPPSGAQLDFRVQALYAYRDPKTIDHIGLVHEALLVEATSGDWSKIQKITITYGPSSSPSSQATIQPEKSPATPDNNQPQTPEFVFNPFFLLGIGALVGGVVVAVVMVSTRRYLKTSSNNNFPNQGSRKFIAI